MELGPFPNEAVNVAHDILLIVKLAWNVSIEAKRVTIESEEHALAVILQFTTKCSSLRKHLEKTDSKWVHNKIRVEVKTYNSIHLLSLNKIYKG